ncbi:hypothetical protein RJ640_004012 [Escallonia rubra]|uniref:Uncharacterized protein n=1 Tax=Escallonia rubra TaxID=112253 RepID=A0AA88QKQ5_9ASTE|nr:hypothetical protein RJ640_004012 [Escallonia rubra]
MPVMEKLKMFVVQEPVVTASCLIAGVGLFLPAVVRPMLDSFESSKEVPQPVLTEVVASMTESKDDCKTLVLHVLAVAHGINTVL